MEKNKKREQNIAIFQKTQSIIEKNATIQNKTKESIEQSIIYLKPLSFIGIEKEKKDTKYIFAEKGTIEALWDLCDQKKNNCVLNFASAKHPGGGVVTGSNAQEESLCRVSNLYNILKNRQFDDFYIKKDDKISTLYTDRTIYTPNVIVFGKNDMVSTLKTKTMSVITCAAPNVSHYSISEDKLYGILLKRIRNIVLVAIENNVDNFILGAFGCGVFKNPPNLVAKAFYTVLVEESYDKYFENIIFAIPTNSSVSLDNYNVFLKQFKHLL